MIITKKGMNMSYIFSTDEIKANPKDDFNLLTWTTEKLRTAVNKDMEDDNFKRVVHKLGTPLMLQMPALASILPLSLAQFDVNNMGYLPASVACDYNGYWQVCGMWGDPVPDPQILRGDDIYCTKFDPLLHYLMSDLLCMEDFAIVAYQNGEPGGLIANFGLGD